MITLLPGGGVTTLNSTKRVYAPLRLTYATAETIPLVSFSDQTSTLDFACHFLVMRQSVIDQNSVIVEPFVKGKNRL